jgi:cysteinyl-tRNA synthetase
MSKSLGNFTTIRALLDSGVAPMTLRLFVLQAHYRKPLDFTAAGLEAAGTGWAGLAAALAVGDDEQLDWTADAHEPPAGDLAEARGRFLAAMDDDLNTAAALGELFELARPLRSLANRLRSGDAPGDADRRLQERWRLLVELTGVLGLRGAAAGGAVGIVDSGLAERLRQRLRRRLEAKRGRDFATADRLRDEILAEGVDLYDKAAGVTTASGGPLPEPITVSLEQGGA